MPPSNAIAYDEDVHLWNSWTPEQAAARLQSISATEGRPIRWATAGGWALDLFLGRVTRDHEDLEIEVLNEDVPTVLDAFAGPEWRWNVPHDGWLHPLDSSAYAETHQTWLWSKTANAFVLDVFREKHDSDTWICRRDPTITMPWSAVADTSADGTPYLIPEVVLLFKAKHARPKDIADLKTVLPSLNAAQREATSHHRTRSSAARLAGPDLTQPKHALARRYGEPVPPGAPLKDV